jgi:hypothetical protein
MLLILTEEKDSRSGGLGVAIFCSLYNCSSISLLCCLSRKRESRVADAIIVFPEPTEKKIADQS